MAFAGKSHRVLRGFTLMEVLVSLGVLAILTSAMGAYLWDLRSQTLLLKDLTDDRRYSELLFQTIEEHLGTAISQTMSGEPGMTGEADSLVLTSRKIMPGASSEMQRITPMQGVRIEFDRESNTVWLAASDRPDAREAISHRVERLRFRFFDGRQWSDRFAASGDAALPALIEVGLWFQPPGAPRTTVEPDGASAIPAEEEFVNRFAADEVRSTFELIEERERERIVRAPDRLRVFAVVGGEVESR
ncbi:MAG: prepilin-type N-terminal cleavage/methylation domain-containing protein [Phycisphaeraceae bacterium]|nr:MAG: prepilin-type N-terminal cleavage/methylation domain-containing protein [Phycisphaeraceae bacterium]